MENSTTPSSPSDQIECCGPGGGGLPKVSERCSIVRKDRGGLSFRRARRGGRVPCPRRKKKHPPTAAGFAGRKPLRRPEEKENGVVLPPDSGSLVGWSRDNVIQDLWDWFSMLDKRERVAVTAIEDAVSARLYSVGPTHAVAVAGFYRISLFTLSYSFAI